MPNIYTFSLWLWFPYLWKERKNKRASGETYKASTVVNYDSRFVNISKLLVSTTLES